MTCEFTISASLKSSKDRIITFRNIKNIDPQLLSSSIAELPVTDSVDCYNSALSSILDVEAPLKERVVSFTRSSTWYTNELRALKAEGRKIERLYKKSGLTVHKLMFEEQQMKCHLALKSTREAYYSHLINEGAENPRLMFKKQLTNFLNLIIKIFALLLGCVINSINILQRKFKIFIVPWLLVPLCCLTSPILQINFLSFLILLLLAQMIFLN